MVDVAYKDLCIDVTAGIGRPAAVARFWADVLGLDISTAGGEDFKLSAPDDGPPERTIWINAVPEDIAGKSRVHLDLAVPDGDPSLLLGAGASVIRSPDGGRPWHVLEDPDGAVLCVFPAAADQPQPTVTQLVVDADEPLQIATWWAERTGATVHRHPTRPFVWLEGVAGLPFARWEFNPVPEVKTHKNRIHWDVTLVDASVDDLVAAGATVLRNPTGTSDWWVLADPEGNEFCAFR